MTYNLTGQLHDSPEWARERILTLEAENLLLRQLLWVWHGCPFEARYGDDGEMQCQGVPDGHGVIDFKRDPVTLIQDMLQAPSLRYVAEHQDDRCRHCGVTRWTFEATSPCSAATHEWVTSKPEESEA